MSILSHQSIQDSVAIWEGVPVWQALWIKAARLTVVGMGVVMFVASLIYGAERLILVGSHYRKIRAKGAARLRGLLRSVDFAYSTKDHADRRLASLTQMHHLSIALALLPIMFFTLPMLKDLNILFATEPQNPGAVLFSMYMILFAQLTVWLIIAHNSWKIFKLVVAWHAFSSAFVCVQYLIGT